MEDVTGATTGGVRAGNRRRVVHAAQLVVASALLLAIPESL